MQISINQIAVKDRIRKDYGSINELADDIKVNGLINPPVITSNHTLIAGERRIKACQLLGWTAIEVRVMEVRDYEHQLKLEISENENRKELTHSERVAYAREVERIEKEKARERQQEHGGTAPGKPKTLPENFPEVNPKGEVREIVARSVGYGSGRTYEEAKYVIKNAGPEIIAKLDAGEISVYKAYRETRQQKEEADVNNSEPIELEPKRDPVFKPYSYTPPTHVEAPVLQKMLEDINMEVMLFFVKFEEELLKLEMLGDFEYKIGAYVDAFHKHGSKLEALIILKKEYEKDACKLQKSANK